MAGIFIRPHELPLMNSESTDLVSVGISCYNHEHYINEAIRSVLAQTYPSFEIIVVDDGSTDKSCDVVRSFSEVKCVRQRNAGTPAATRNRGLQESRGDYVVFLDGDDRLLPDALEIGRRHLREHPDCAFACRSLPGNERRTKSASRSNRRLLSPITIALS